MLDEIRLVRNLRSADWIKTSYNNQGDPGTFYSVGDEEKPPSGTIVLVR